MNEHISFLAQVEAQDEDNMANEDDEEFNLKLEIIADKDQLTTYLDTYKETMETKISGCEKTIN